MPTLEETFAEWECLAEKGSRFTCSRSRREKVTIDVEELLAWCKSRGLSVNASARSQYVAELVRKRDLHYRHRCLTLCTLGCEVLTAVTNS